MNPVLGPAHDGQGEHNADHEEHPGHGRRVTHVAVLESVLVKVVDVEQKRVLGTSGVCAPTAGSPGQHEGRREDLDPEDGPVDQVEKDHRRNKGESDFVEAPEWSRSIDQRRFVELGRNRPQARQKYQSRSTCAELSQKNDRDLRPACVTQPVDRGYVEQLKYVVDEAEAGVEEQYEDEGQRE